MAELIDFEKASADGGIIAKQRSGSDLPPIKAVNRPITSAQNQTRSLTNKEGDHASGEVKKMVKKVSVSVSNCPQNPQSEVEKKLEGTKRKLRERYELIENQKKKRSVQIIDYLKPQPPSMEPPLKKQQRKKPVRLFK